jgi:iduronate 2-sulfatase
VAPKRYYDRYPPSSIRLPSNYSEPENAPRIALTNWAELRGYRDMPQTGPLSEDQARQLIRAYYAATTYADAQIGRILDALERLDLSDNTIVVVWGDHGWHLGEQGLWCKHTNFEMATRAPLVITRPKLPRGRAGATSNALVEFVDIYPTLTELAGLPRPDNLEGVSLVPLLTAPDRPWKRAAFSQYPRGKGMGYSIRTDRYRYTEWSEGERIVRELYDHRTDPAETRNVADAPQHQSVVRDLGEQLRAGWRKALPST